jgi:hypothetical protein
LCYCHVLALFVRVRFVSCAKKSVPFTLPSEEYSTKQRHTTLLEDWRVVKKPTGKQVNNRILSIIIPKFRLWYHISVQLELLAMVSDLS